MTVSASEDQSGDLKRDSLVSEDLDDDPKESFLMRQKEKYLPAGRHRLMRAWIDELIEFPR